ncbi:uncharacterized protein VTP21DRAFT_239 [Calcarisporiella thermophila]|uniref:uncharacterized protein n=1 Tax=Calcarisporiella thermophila TaxID=911321 RepID=UPI0037423AFB
MKSSEEGYEALNPLVKNFDELTTEVEKVTGQVDEYLRQIQQGNDRPKASPSLDSEEGEDSEDDVSTELALVSRSSSTRSSFSSISTLSDSEDGETVVGNGLWYGVYLRNITDLHLLMVQNFGSDYATLTSFTPKDHPKISVHISIKGPVSRRLLLIEEPTDNAVIFDKDKLPTNASVAHHPLLHQLFTTYLSPCFFFLQPANRDELMELFFAKELEPAFLFSAVAWAALHIYQCHKDPPYADLLPGLANSAYLEAQRHLQEVFDEPSEQLVVASFNLGMYHLLNSRPDEFYVQLGHAIAMARLLGIYIEDLNEPDPIRAETKRRIWWALYTHDSGLAVYSRKTQTLLFPQASKVVRPKCLPGEGQAIGYCLDYVIKEAELLTCLKKLPEIDWDTSDEAVLQTLLCISEDLRPYIRSLDIELPVFGEDTKFFKARLAEMTWVDLAYPPHFWSTWGQIWYRFLEPDRSLMKPPPPNRMDTPKMKALRSLALNECSRAASWITLLLEETARRHDWCHTLPISATQASCRMHKYVAKHHPDQLTRRTTSPISSPSTSPPTSPPKGFSLPDLNLKVHDPFFGVPSQNKSFIDRPSIFRQITIALNTKTSFGECKVVALFGLGGIGKTQIMLRYCYANRQKYGYIFWLSAENWATTVDEFRNLAINLGYDEAVAKENGAEEKAIFYVRSSLEARSNWLLLLDNVDETTLKNIFNCLPRYGGDILLTTREPIPLIRANIIRIEKLNEEEALSLLFHPDPINSINRNETRFRNACKIVNELDYMPLAIVLARAFISNSGFSFLDYLAALQKHRGILFSFYNADDVYEHTLATVWNISFERIRVQDPATVQILEICVFLQANSIPTCLFEKQYSVLGLNLTLHPSPLNDLISEGPLRAVKSAIAKLNSYLFVTLTYSENEDNEESFPTNVVSIPRLVHKVVYNAMSEEKKYRWTDRIADALNRETEYDDEYAVRTREIMKTYLPHFRHFVSALAIHKQSEDLESMLSRIIPYIIRNRIYPGTELLAQYSLKISEAIYGSDSPDTATSINNLVLFLTRQVCYGRAVVPKSTGNK